MAAAACPTCEMKEVPPRAEESVYDGRSPRYSAVVIAGMAK